MNSKNIILTLLLCVLFALPSDAAKRKTVQVDTLGLACRGVMETFPKVSEGIETRLEFYKAEGLTHYFYCPSDDRYCNRWGWKFLYNDSDRHMLKSLRTLCQNKGMDFVWTLNPGENYGWKDTDYKFLLDKLIMMYYNGLRSFALDFTDNRGNHQAVRDSLQKHFIQTRKEKVSVFFIDDLPAVEYPSEGKSSVESMMRGYHFDAEFQSRAKKEDAVICSISSSDEFAKLAAMAVADFASDPSSYSPDQSMADAVKMLHGDVREAFITFLTHTGQVDESSAIETFVIEDWTKEKSDALYEEFDRIEKVPQLIGEHADSEIITALQPWLTEFGRLGTRGKKVLQCMEHYVAGNLRDFWITYIDAVPTMEQLISYELYPVGSGKLQPFCMESLEIMKNGFTSVLTGKKGMDNLASTLYVARNEALDFDFTTSVQTDGYMDFAIPAAANTCHLLTGKLPAGKRLFFRQLATDGSLVAEFILNSAYTSFDLKHGAVKVDVVGDAEIYECIFVNLPY